MVEQITTDDVARCLERYPSIGAVTEVTRLAGAFHNTVFRVSTEEGVFYLKALTTHTTESTEARYEFLDWAMEQFRQIGVEAPIALRNAEGRRLTPCGGYPAVLSAALGGDEFHEERLAQQESVGRALGLFHRTAAQETRRGSSWLKPLGGYLLHDRSLLDDLPDVPEAPAIRQWWDELVARSGRIARELEDCGYAALPRSAVHSEVTGKHLRARGDRVSGVLDFEYACWDARVIDVGRTLAYLFCLGPKAESDGPDRARALLTGYNSAGEPLDTRELAALPIIVKAWDFECITFFIHQVFETRAPIQRFSLAERIPEWLKRVDWWDGHGEECADRLVAPESQSRRSRDGDPSG